MDYNLKKAIKSNIEKLPLGSTVFLPCLKFIYNPPNIRSKYLKKRAEIKEAKRPVVILGWGIHLANAYKETRKDNIHLIKMPLRR